MSSQHRSSPAARHHWLLPLLAIVALGSFARFYRLDVEGLGVDEAFSWRITRYPIPVMVRKTAEDVHPPLYYLALKGWTALCGTSPLALRSLSAILGILAIPLLFAACAGIGIEGRTDPRSEAVIYSGALLSAFLLALSPTQVEYSRYARMYSLGVLLACAATWLLLKAMASRRPSPYWIAYGLTIALFLYTHYYSIYCVAAHVAFFAGCLLAQSRGDGPGHPGRSAAMASGFVAANAIALLSVMPWVPVFLSQLAKVRANFWLPPLARADYERIFLTWSTGLISFGPIESWAAFGLFVGLFAWLARKSDRLTMFLLLQAITPWVIGIAYSQVARRPLVIERFLAFSQVALLGLWAAVWSRLPDPLMRAALAGSLGLTCVVGLCGTIGQIGEKRPAIQQVGELLKARAAPGDLVLVIEPIAVNLIRYYGGRAGAGSLCVRCRLADSTQSLHMDHFASLDDGEVIWVHDGAYELGAERVWHVVDLQDPSTVNQPPPGMDPRGSWIFEGGSSATLTNSPEHLASRYRVTEYVERPADESTR